MPPKVTSASASAVENLIKRGLVHHQAGAWDEAEALYRAALKIDRDNLNALQLLGAVAFSTRRAAEAVTLLRRAEKLVAGHGGNPAQYSTLYNNLGNALGAAGRINDAIASYRKSLALAPANAEAQVNLATLLAGQGNKAGAIAAYEAALAHEERLDWRHRLGRLYTETERFADAEACYRAVLKVKADHASALYDLGLLLHLKLDQPREAVGFFERLRATDPAHIEVHGDLGNAFHSAGLLDDAVAAYRRYLELVPDSAMARIYLGMSLSERGSHDEAIACLEDVLAQNVSDAALVAQAHLELGNALLRAECGPEAEEQFRAALTSQAFFTCKAVIATPKFSALFLLAPGSSNTPHAYLTTRCDYDALFALVLPGAASDIGELKAHADVVVNLISDAEAAAAFLPAATALIDQLQRPVINHPDKILPTGRAAIARIMAAIPGCRVARFRTFTAAELWDDPAAASAAFTPPFLARVVGLHGGDGFEKIEDPGALPAFVQQNPAAEYYLMDYLDYRSPDGFFRKYRFFWVDGALLPYHLSIGDDWKVHQFRTDLANKAWMQEEEAAFLAHPEQVFTADQIAILQTIAESTALDFAGIDCGLDTDGNVVLFETNATMLVNGDTRAFPYKTPYVARIKAAFDAMLARRVAF